MMSAPPTLIQAHTLAEYRHGFSEGRDQNKTLLDARNPAHRTRICASLGTMPATLAIPHQVHSATCLWVGRTHLATFHGPDPPHADALLCQTSGLAVGVLTADCVPVLLAQPDTRTVGAIHAGWKGAAAHIVARTLDALPLPPARATVLAAVGPAIPTDAYEVDAPVRNRFPHEHRFFSPSRQNRWLLDLTGLVREQLRQHGVHTQQLQEHTHLTHRRLPRFFSHRRDGPACGRHLSLIVCP